jgi:multimeric flavodoxin WrbA
MQEKTVVMLDGTGSADGDLNPVRDALCQALKASSAELKIFTLREMKLAHCLGCFKCWIKTPGMCVESDEGREVAKAVIRSDAAVLFTPVTFGGYSPDLKKMLDHFIQLISPLFQIEHGETHHPPRYKHRPRLMVVGVQRQNNPAEARIFKTLAGRNAINLHPPSYAAEVVQSSDDPAALRARFEGLLARSDALPYGEVAAAVMPGPAAKGIGTDMAGTRRALLIVGSPKTGELSTSSALGGFLLERVKHRGWETESLTLRASLNRPEGQQELLAAVERAGLIVLAFPLYADALPYLVTRALTVIAAAGKAGGAGRAKGAAAIVNSGFPETHQNAVALAICREFATQCGFSWAGGLAFGGGGMIGGEPLAQPSRSGPGVRHVVTALDMTAEALAKGLPVPGEAMSMIARKGVSAALLRWFYMFMASRSFKKLAAKNGVAKEELMAQPYAA